MRENELKQVENVLELILVESSGERTFIGAKLDNLTEIEVITTLLKFYIKIGFSHTNFRMQFRDFKIAYVASESRLYITPEGGMELTDAIECEKWGTEQ